MNPKVDFFFNKAKQWQNEYKKLREIALSSEAVEELKWGVPCYQINKKNVFLIHGFKEYCAILFHKGALMKDPEGLLIQQTENVQAARQMRFTGMKELEWLEPIIKSYMAEAIEIERAGLQVEMKKTSEFNMPEEFEQALNDSEELKTAFYNLTPGRQRGYLLYFSQAKQAKTRLARIEKYYDQIMNGKGLDD